MTNWINHELMVTGGLLTCLISTTASSQTFERDVTVTGPRGRTLERKTEIHRGPGAVERDIQISRPSGTYSRQVEVHRAPGFAPRGPAFGPRYLPFGPPPPRYGPSTGALVGLGIGLAALPAIGFAAGAASRPPVVIAPGAVMSGSPSMVEGAPPVQGPMANAADPVNLSAQKLYSNFYTSRRDGAVELGRLGDPRGVPALIHVLKYDNFKEVRIAAAHSLGQIGGPQAATALERCIVYEKRQPVRDAASAALTHLRAHEATVVESYSSNVVPTPAPRASSRPPQPQGSTRQSNPGWIPSANGRSPKAAEPLPTLEGPSPEEATAGPEERTTPPPPTPVNP